MTTDAVAVTYEVVESARTLVEAPAAQYVRETPTGLVFSDDTPLGVWSVLVVRLLTQHKRIEWAIADAINFGERRYGEVYSQWVEESGLAKKTLANIAWVGRSIERSRRREDVDFSYHAEVAPLPPAEQDRLLETAVEQGMTRYELREAARERKAQLRGRAVDANGTPIEEPEPLVWTAQKDDLTPEARAELEQRLLGIGKRHVVGYTAGWLQALVWLGEESAFLPGRWRM